MHLLILLVGAWIIYYCIQVYILKYRGPEAIFWATIGTLFFLLGLYAQVN